MDTFYFAPFACSFVSHVVLHETGHPHRAVRLRGGPLGLGDEAFAALNPARAVPVLETEAGAIAQSTAILFHLAEAYPGAGLLPDTRAGLTELRSVLAICTSDVHPELRMLLRPQDYAGVEQVASLVPRWRDRATRALALLDGKLGARPYLAGERLSVVDPYAVVFSLWAAHVGLTPPARLAALATRLRERPAVQAVMAIEQREHAAKG